MSLHKNTQRERGVDTVARLLIPVSGKRVRNMRVLGCVCGAYSCSHRKTAGCTRAEGAPRVPGVLDSCWSPGSRLNTPGQRTIACLKTGKKTGQDNFVWRFVGGGGRASLLSAGPKARSYKLLGATFPTASRNRELVMVFTLNFLDRGKEKIRVSDTDCCFDNAGCQQFFQSQPQTLHSFHWNLEFLLGLFVEHKKKIFKNENLLFPESSHEYLSLVSYICSSYHCCSTFCSTLLYFLYLELCWFVTFPEVLLEIPLSAFLFKKAAYR